MRSKNTFPGIARSNDKRDPAQDAVYESLEVLTGQRGNGENRALLVKDLINLDELKRKQLVKATQGNSNSGGLPINVIGGIERPHAPVNLTGTGGFTFIALTWDHPTYRGHAYAEVYRSDTDTFSNAVMIATEVTDIFSDTVNMGSKYFYWVRFVNVANMKGPTQGASGLYVQTMQSAETILAELGGKIENSHLGGFLSGEVGKIPGLSFDVDQARLAADEVLSSNDGLAIDLINSALANDGNWQSVVQNIASISNTVNQNKASVELNYYTKVDADTAITIKTEALEAKLLDPEGNSIGAALYNNYYTIATANTAISTANTTLKTAIENPDGYSIGANLKNNFYTKTTADTAIARASTTLQALIEDAEGNSVGASLQTLSKTVATNDEQWAMWAVKATVAGITAGFGLVNDGVDPIFAIKGAKFAVITSQDPTVATPVFGVVGDKTVIRSALIDEAHIQTLVTDDLLSNRVVIGSKLTTPSINYDPITGNRSGNFSMDPSGNAVAKSMVLESVTIKDAQGNVVMSSTGAIASSNVSGLGALATADNISLSSVTGTGAFAGLSKILSSNVTTYIASGAIGSVQIDQAYIGTLFGNNARFLGTVYAEKIEGDLVDGDVVSVGANAGAVHLSWSTIKTISVNRSDKFDVWLTINDLVPTFYTVAGFGSLYTRLKYGTQVGKAVSIVAGASVVSIEIQVKKIELTNSEVPVDTSVPTQNAILQMFRKGSGFII